MNLADLWPGVVVVEDCCEAMGARWKGQHVGTFGTAGAFSFFFSHLINTMEGGMVVTDSPADDRLYRLWRSHGWEPKEDYRFWFPTWGLNVRPTELQGAFGCVQMERLEGFRQARRCNAQLLAESTFLAHPDVLRGVSVLPDCEPSWHGFALMVARDAPFSRDVLCHYLDEHDVETRPIVAGNLARQPAVMNDERIICGSLLLGADAIHERGFYIGLQSHQDDAGTEYVAETVDAFVKGY
jgi:CDP-6-deoxy-D-xylo-4-hexulose-3-dehydrase